MGGEGEAERFLVRLTGLAAIGGFLFGYDKGGVAGAMVLMRREFQLSSVWQETIVSVTVGAAGTAR